MNDGNVIPSKLIGSLDNAVERMEQLRHQEAIDAKLDIKVKYPINVKSRGARKRWARKVKAFSIRHTQFRQILREFYANYTVRVDGRDDKYSRWYTRQRQLIDKFYNGKVYISKVGYETKYNLE